MVNDKLETIVSSCLSHIEEVNYFSYDLFDALTCPWLNSLTKMNTLVRRIVIQLSAKSVIDFHWIGMKQMQHTKTISDSLWAICLLSTAEIESQEKIEKICNLLLEKKSKSFYVWGLNFPYATRFIDASENMPNLYNTCTAGIAISHYCDLTKRRIDLLEKIYWDICNVFEYIDEGSKGFFIYYPGQKHPTYNVNALALYLFSRINKISSKDVIPSQRIEQILNLLISEQLENGAWYYSRSKNGKWIDGFHTGFIIESLIDVYLNGYSTFELKQTIDKAIMYYIENLFTRDGFPKYFDFSRKYPIEAQNCAQAIQTLSFIKKFGSYEVDDLLGKVIQNTLDSLYSGNGFFYYKKTKQYTDKSSYLRWNTTPMLVALLNYVNQ